MRKIIYILSLCFWGSLFPACSGFLEEYSQDLTYIRTVDDLNELLVGGGYFSSASDVLPMLHVMDDDTEYERKATTVGYWGFHYWLANPFVSGAGVEQKDGIWSSFYKYLAVINVILNKADDFTSEGDAYRKVKGESYFLRGMDYFYLVNLYAKPYKAETAANEPGVPLKLTEYVEDKHYERATVAEVYASVVSDLENAITYLNGTRQITKRRANVDAARAMLGRVYLYMGGEENWKKCNALCDSVLQSGRYELYDIKEHTPKKDFIFLDSPETIFTQGKNSARRTIFMGQPSVAAYTLSQDLLGNYDANVDLRYSHWFNSVKNVGWVWLKYSVLTASPASEVSSEFLLRLPEVYLNKAEALIMLGRTEEAIDVLRTLREKRLAAGTTDVIPTSQEDLVQFVRLERRLELCGEGHRWFDLRRYAVHPTFPEEKEIVHESVKNGSKIGYYRLAPYSENSNNWVWPIPEDAVIFNDGALVANERDGAPLVEY